MASVTFSTSTRKLEQTMPVAFLRGGVVRGYGVDGPAPVELSRHDGVVAGPVVHGDGSGHDPLGDVGPGQDRAALVVDLDDVAVDDAAGGRILGCIHRGS